MPATTGRVVFLDRDGVINRDPAGWTRAGYVTVWENFQFLPGALVALRLLREHNVQVILISNQAGVGKGCLSQEDLDDITRRMCGVVAEHGGSIRAVYYCTHHPDEGCSCRKPKPGLFEIARRELGVDPSGAYFIGDSPRDIDAGHAAGCRVILVQSGVRTPETRPIGSSPDHVEDSLLSAVRWMLGPGDSGQSRLKARPL